MTESNVIEVRALTKRHDPDLVYFYCHALAKTLKSGIDIGATLDFGADDI